MQNTLSLYTTILYKDFTTFCDKELYEMGLSRGLLYFVLYLGRNPNCSPSNISQALHFDSGHTTRSIDKLVNTGFVIRKKSEEDKRVYKLQLTEKGNQVFEESRVLFSKWDEKIFEGISADERELLMPLLEKLISKSKVKGYGREI
jgi:DNA-binding MarR family transcriptional regulator